MATTTSRKTLTVYGADEATLTLRVAPGWQHIWNHTHYRISEHQAARVKAFFAAHGQGGEWNTRSLHVVDGPGGCPHCEGSLEVIKARE